jgi:hypothetical protein
MKKTTMFSNVKRLCYVFLPLCKQLNVATTSIMTNFMQNWYLVHMSSKKQGKKIRATTCLASPQRKWNIDAH